MIVTDRERVTLIKQYTWCAEMYTRKHRYKLSPQDFEELFSDCLMAISEAIDDNKDNSPFTLQALVRICVKHAIWDWFEKYNAEKRVYARSYQSTFTDLEDQERDDYVAGECPHHKGVTENRDDQLTLSILKDKNVISEEEWGILDKKMRGYLDEEIGEPLGIMRSGIQFRKSRAIKKLQEVV